MLKCLFLKGLPASGKSTYAKKLIDQSPGKYKRINKDDLRAMLDNSHWTKANEKFVLKMRDMLILEALENGYSSIIDDTNFFPEHEIHIRELVKNKAQFEIVDFSSVSVEECIERDLHRQNYVGEKVIMDMYEKYLKPVSTVLEPNPDLENCVIVDMDGTLALLNGRSPYDASTCENDLVNEQVACYVRHLARSFTIFIVSGRKEKDRAATISWLISNDIPYAQLFMRKDEDNRKDNMVKNEIYSEYIKNFYNVWLVIDDRKSVCQMWRENGLKVFQVAEGNY